MSVEDFDASFAALKSDLAALKSQKSAAIDAEMEALSDAVSQSNFKLVLEKRTGPLEKPVFVIDGTAAAFFIVKQLQFEHEFIVKLFIVKQFLLQQQLLRRHMHKCL